jgi:hypothetical protein
MSLARTRVSVAAIVIGLLGLGMVVAAVAAPPQGGADLVRADDVGEEATLVPYLVVGLEGAIVLLLLVVFGPALMAFVRPRLRSAFVVLTSVAVTAMTTAFIFAGSPPADPEPKSGPTTRLKSAPAAGVDCLPQRFAQMNDSGCWAFAASVGH